MANKKVKKYIIDFRNTYFLTFQTFLDKKDESEHDFEKKRKKKMT